MAAELVPEGDYQNLRETVAVLEQRVASLESHLDVDVRRSTSFPDVRGLEDEIVRITKDLFPGDVAIKVTDDPEHPQDSYTAVHAHARGEIEEIEDRRIQWHERIEELSPHLRLLRLSLAYQT